MRENGTFFVENIDEIDTKYTVPREDRICCRAKMPSATTFKTFRAGNPTGDSVGPIGMTMVMV